MNCPNVDGKQDKEMYSFICPRCGCRFEGGWEDVIGPHIIEITQRKAIVEYRKDCPLCAARTADMRFVYF